MCAIQLPRRVVIGWYIGLAGWAFDRRHGTETREVVEFPDQLVSGDNQQFGNSYVPTPPKMFHRIMRNLDICFKDFTFIDFGSGKGRAVLIALEYGFRNVIGVDHSIPLHNAAEENVRALRSRKPINLPPVELFCSDASKLEFRSGNKVLYFFNPFSEKVMTTLLDNLLTTIKTESSFPKIYLIHIPPESWDLNIFSRYGFVLLKRLRIADYTGKNCPVLIFYLMAPSP